MNLEYAINTLKNEKAHLERDIPIYKEEIRKRKQLSPVPYTHYEELISLCKINIKTLNKGIEILSRFVGIKKKKEE